MYPTDLLGFRLSDSERSKYAFRESVQLGRLLKAAAIPVGSLIQFIHRKKENRLPIGRAKWNGRQDARTNHFSRLTGSE